MSSETSYYDDGNVNWLNTADLNNSIVYETRRKVTSKALAETSLKVYPKGSLAIAMYGQGDTRGNVGLVAIEAACNQAALVMSGAFDSVPKFMLWWFISRKSSIRQINTGATQPNMNQDFVRNLLIALPPLAEQQAIADYLDAKTAQIDRKIDLLTQKAAKYRQLKQSIINAAVTRGLDTSAPMKDSGVEWMGRIPEHWHVERLKDLAQIKTGGRDTIDNVTDGEYPFFVRSQTVERIDTYSFDGEAILTAGDGVGVGKVFHHFVGKFDYHQRVYRISHFRRVQGKLLFYFMRQNFYKDALRFNSKATVDSLRLPMFRNFPVPFGGLSEQQAIVEYLDTKTAQIDRIVETSNAQIDKLKDLRKALINDVVTGKLRVT